MKTYISVNVVSQSLILINCIYRNNCYSCTDLPQIKLPFGVGLETSLSFAVQCAWVRIIDGIIEFTKDGLLIEKSFNGEMISKKLWKTILSQYISVCQPAWSKRIPYGRKEAFYFMNEEEQRCFIEADLIENQEEDVIAWWDRIAEEQRIKANTLLDDIGRIGERLTLKFEELRTGIRPKWISVDSNVSGYDILSTRSRVDTDAILIEVKTSVQRFDKAYAVISRHEWDVASLQNNKERYFFYIWNTESHRNMLAIVPAEEMKMYIPVDSNSGRWDIVRIPFNSFADKFIEVY